MKLPRTITIDISGLNAAARNELREQMRAVEHYSVEIAAAAACECLLNEILTAKISARREKADQVLEATEGRR